MNTKVDDFFAKTANWKEELERLRRIALDCQLTEELKWGWPCYTYEGNNIVLLHGFKEYCAILFIKGALLKDASGILVRQTENVQAGRQVRFTNPQQVDKLAKTLKAYIREAIEVEKSGLKVEAPKADNLGFPGEFQAKLDEMPALKTAFAALTPGRRRAYLLFFSAPKQFATRVSRVEKCVQRILEGKGLDDR